jgi:hypothetical protein
MSYKRIVLQLLLLKRKDTDPLIEEDINLYGFAYFLSVNRQFKYTDTYLMDKIVAFSKRIINFQSRFSKMIKDLQTIIREMPNWKAGTSFRVDNWLALNSKDESGKENYTLIEDGFDKILQFDDWYYHIQVVWNDTLLGTVLVPIHQDEYTEEQAKLIAEKLDNLINLRTNDSNGRA